MNLSIESIDGIKQLSKTKRAKLLFKISNELNLGRAYSALFFLSILISMVLSTYVSVDIDKGYFILACSFIIWMVGYLLLINLYVAPKAVLMIKELSDS